MIETRVFSLRWDGDIDGVLVVTHDRSGRPEESTFDRPGDLVALGSGALFPSEQHLAAAAFYGVVLASRGVPEVTYVCPIVEKAVKFMVTLDPSSLALMRELSRLKSVVVESDLEGAAVRELVLGQARALHERAVGD